MTVQAKPYNHPSAWRGPDMAARGEWPGPPADQDAPEPGQAREAVSAGRFGSPELKK